MRYFDSSSLTSQPKIAVAPFVVPAGVPVPAVFLLALDQLILDHGFKYFDRAEFVESDEQKKQVDIISLVTIFNFD